MEQITEQITEQNYTVEQLDALAEALEPLIIDVEAIPLGGFLLGTISKILPVKTDYGVRMDYFGKLKDGKDFKASNWGCKTRLKPSELLSREVKFLNKTNRKIVIE